MPSPDGLSTPLIWGALERLANRGYTDGFYQRHHSHEQQNYLSGHSQSDPQQFVGEISRIDAARGLAEVVVKNKFAVGDKLEMISPNGNQNFVLTTMENLQSQAMEVAPGGEISLNPQATWQCSV